MLLLGMFGSVRWGWGGVCLPDIHTLAWHMPQHHHCPGCPTFLCSYFFASCSVHSFVQWDKVCAVHAGLRITMYLKMSLNFWFYQLHFLIFGITGIQYHSFPYGVLDIKVAASCILGKHSDWTLAIPLHSFLNISPTLSIFANIPIINCLMSLEC